MMATKTKLLGKQKMGGPAVKAMPKTQPKVVPKGGNGGKMKGRGSKC